MRGFFMTLGICSILVPIPCDMRPTVFLEAHDRKTHHVAAAAHYRSASGKKHCVARIVERNSHPYSRARCRQSEQNSHNHGNYYSHKERSKLRGKGYAFAELCQKPGYGRTKRDRNDSRDKHCQKRQYDYIQLCSARNERANLRGNQSGKISSYRIADAYGYLKRRKPAACVCARHTCDYAGKNRKLVAFERIGNASAYSRAHHKFRNGCHLQKQIAYPIAVRTAEQLAQLLENRPRNQRGEKPQSHTRKSVYKPTLGQPSDHQTKAALFAFGRLCFLNFRFRCVFLFVHISPLFKLQNLFHFIHNFNKGFFVERTL